LLLPDGEVLNPGDTRDRSIMALSQALSDYVNVDFEVMRPAGFLQKESSQIAVTVANVDRGQGWITNHVCPLCRSDERSVRFERFGKRVLQCSRCGVGYAEGFPAAPNDVYSEEGYFETQDANYLHNAEYRKQRFAAERLQIIARHLKRDPHGVRLLDVGCGTGWFLEVARKEGYTVAGLEVGTELARFTAERLGVEVFTEPLTALSATERFDVITLFDVVEHVSDPRGLLSAVRAHLSPGGIALLFTPNLDSLGLAILGAQSSLVMPAEHLFYFTPHSLRRLIEETGLNVVGFSTKGMDIADMFSFYRDVGKIGPVADFLRERGSMLQAIVDAAGCANHMRFVVSA
jgi:2-polyprenyl-3-methyl-5-hydroxy-6-metoxy-1,4-benzoquinol methylase